MTKVVNEAKTPLYKARKQHNCGLCLLPIAIGQEYCWYHGRRRKRRVHPICYLKTLKL